MFVPKIKNRLPWNIHERRLLYFEKGPRRDVVEEERNTTEQPKKTPETTSKPVESADEIQNNAQKAVEKDQNTITEFMQPTLTTAQESAEEVRAAMLQSATVMLQGPIAGMVGPIATIAAQLRAQKQLPDQPILQPASPETSEEPLVQDVQLPEAQQGFIEQSDTAVEAGQYPELVQQFPGVAPKMIDMLMDHNDHNTEVVQSICNAMQRMNVSPEKQEAMVKAISDVQKQNPDRYSAMKELNTNLLQTLIKLPGKQGDIAIQTMITGFLREFCGGSGPAVEGQLSAQAQGVIQRFVQKIHNNPDARACYTAIGSACRNIPDLQPAFSQQRVPSRKNLPQQPPIEPDNQTEKPPLQEGNSPPLDEPNAEQSEREGNKPENNKDTNGTIDEQESLEEFERRTAENKEAIRSVTWKDREGACIRDICDALGSEPDELGRFTVETERLTTVDPRITRLVFTDIQNKNVIIVHVNANGELLLAQRCTETYERNGIILEGLSSMELSVLRVAEKYGFELNEKSDESLTFGEETLSGNLHEIICRLAEKIFVKHMDDPILQHDDLRIIKMMLDGTDKYVEYSYPLQTVSRQDGIAILENIPKPHTAVEVTRSDGTKAYEVRGGKRYGAHFAFDPKQGGWVFGGWESKVLDKRPYPLMGLNNPEHQEAREIYGSVAERLGIYTPEDQRVTNEQELGGQLKQYLNTPAATTYTEHTQKLEDSLREAEGIDTKEGRLMAMLLSNALELQQTANKIFAEQAGSSGNILIHGLMRVMPDGKVYISSVEHRQAIRKKWYLRKNEIHEVFQVTEISHDQFIKLTEPQKNDQGVVHINNSLLLQELTASENLWVSWIVIEDMLASEDVGEAEKRELKQLKTTLMKIWRETKSLPVGDSRRIEARNAVRDEIAEFGNNVRDDIIAACRRSNRRLQVIVKVCDVAEVGQKIAENVMLEVSAKVAGPLGPIVASGCMNGTYYLTECKTAAEAGMDFAIDSVLGLVQAGAARKYAHQIKRMPGMKRIVAVAVGAMRKMGAPGRKLTAAAVKLAVEDIVDTCKRETTVMSLIKDIAAGKLTAEQIEEAVTQKGVNIASNVLT